jgi:hypothetical protein
MRSILFAVTLGACLGVAGCIGGQKGSVPVAGTSPTVVVAKVVPSTPTSEILSPGGLLKGASTPTAATTPLANETVVAGPQQGPLSCVDQHLKDIQSGKLLSTGACQ